MKNHRIGKILKVFILVFFSLGSVLPAFCENRESPSLPIRRFALIAGSNDGGKNRVKLQYATTDALAFVEVMQEMGGIGEKDRIVLLNPSYSDFVDGLKRVRQMMSRVNRNQERREFILYYSGHSDLEGLLLGSERFGYKRLRMEINDMPSEVHIAIIDSCSSGALTRSKGGIRRPSFLLDASHVMEGYAFLTSSSAQEAAQESDKIKASFFTHYLVSGLRGAADVTSDGLVTLNEAYYYAFRETLASTEKTQFGAQHPAYDINLTGTGDIVLTDIREISAGLSIAEEIKGRLFVRDRAGTLVVELNKLHDQKVDLGLKPGMYTIVLDTPGEKYQATIRVGEGERFLISQADLKSFTGEPTIPRGEEPTDVLPDSQRIEQESNNYVLQRFHFSFLPEFSSSNLGARRVGTIHNVSINLLWGNSTSIYGFEAGAVGNTDRLDVTGFQAAGMCNIVGRDVNGFQAAGLFNRVGRDVGFAQVSGVFNYVGGFMDGVQVSGIFNYSSGFPKGIQTAGVFNYANGGAKGFQSAGIFNYTASDMVGSQVAGVLNFTKGSMSGVQIGGNNYCRYLQGAQIGIVNIAGDAEGMQVGVVNIARGVKGGQIGVLNISKDIRGAPLGFLTITKNGQWHVEMWGDGNRFYHVGFRLGTRSLYTLFTAGYRPFLKPIRWSYGVGLGGHIPLDQFFVNMDVTLHEHHRGFERWYDTGSPNLVPEIRLMGGYQMAQRMGVYAGGSIQIFFPGWYSVEGMSDIIDAGDSDRAFVKPTFFIGFQI